MDATTIAITTDLVGWGLWFILTRQLAAKAPGAEWITVDYYVSTTLLALSTVCTIAGAFLSDPVLVTRVAVPLLLAGLGILVVRSWRGAARTVRLQYTSDAEAARPAAQQKDPPQQWETITAPAPTPRQPAKAPRPPAQPPIFSDPLIRDIESRRMTA